MNEFHSFINYKGKNIALKYHKLLSGNRKHPPNSLSALNEMLENRVEVIEFDISLLADANYACMHDSTLERETSGVGALRAITKANFKALQLKYSKEAPAVIEEFVAILKDINYELKIQLDLKEFLPLDLEAAKALLKMIEPLRQNPKIHLIVGCLADWNLRSLRRLDSRLELGLDFAYHLDAPIGEILRLPARINAYGYLDDHPLGYKNILKAKDYLHDRLETLLSLVPDIKEFYLRKEFVQKALSDGLNPIEFIHNNISDSYVDVWTIDCCSNDSEQMMKMALDAGADQITTNTALQWLKIFEED